MTVDIDRIIEESYKCVLQTSEVVQFLCDRAKDILEDELNVQPVHPPVTVVGDVHGQFHDIIEMFRISGCKFT